LGPKNQSFRNKSGKAQPIRTKLGYVDMLRGDNVQGILGAIGPFMAKWGLERVPRSPSFCGNPEDLSAILQPADFHQIRSRNVVRCSVAEPGKIFSKLFTLGVICPKNLKSKIGQTVASPRAGYRSRDALQFTPRCSRRAREFRDRSTFLYDVRLRSYGSSKWPNFRIWAYFPFTKPL